MEDVARRKTLTVSEFSLSLKHMIEDTFGYVQIKGEVSGFLLHTSGHMYFTLKDMRSVVDCVCWRSQVSGLKVCPEDGMEVVCLGKVTTYAMRSKYQIMIHDVQHCGVGELLKLIEERKKKLAQEGLFDQEYKKPLPKHPKSVAVLTSPTGAVIRDILHRLRERYPCLVYVWPVVVQGSEASASIIAALDAMERSEAYPDVVVIARGGGSIEDLMPFQDEALVRKVFSFPIPVVSAIGHETDVSLLDHVADVRAPTPSAAAEIITPNRSDLLDFLQQTATRFHVLMTGYVRERRNILDGTRITAQRLVETKWLGFDELWGRLVSCSRLDLERRSSAVQHYSTQNVARICVRHLEQGQEALCSCYDKILIFIKQVLRHLALVVEASAQLLASFAPHAVMKRGYTMVEKNGNLVSRCTDLSAGDDINVVFVDGKRKACVQE